MSGNNPSILISGGQPSPPATSRQRPYLLAKLVEAGPKLADPNHSGSFYFVRNSRNSNDINQLSSH